MMDYMSDELTPNEITSAEIKIIRWGEKILTPLLVAGFLGVVAFLSGVNTTMAQLKNEHEKYNGVNSAVTAELRSLNHKIDEQAEARQKLEIAIQRMDTSQQNIKEQVTDLKTQNSEILRLLRQGTR